MESATQIPHRRRISTCVDQGRSGDSGCCESAGKVGIGSKYFDSAGGGWDECMGDSH